MPRSAGPNILATRILTAMVRGNITNKVKKFPSDLRVPDKVFYLDVRYEI